MATERQREELNRDLGFGAVVSRESRQRLLNRDGSFNVVREGLRFFASWSPYHYLLTVSWPRFLGLVIAGFLGANAFFGALFCCLGPGTLTGIDDSGMASRYLNSFFFSVQTFATIGYGHVSPVGIAANLIVTLEALVGLLGFALATGLLFARFSRPTARVLFSRQAIVAPYHGITAFEFRIVNARRNQLIEVQVKLQLSRFRDGRGSRDFQPLLLERDRVTFFPLSWTIVHPIDSESPLFGLTYEDLVASDAEFLILLTGTDETFAQTVHARSSYKADEIVWGARFTNLFNPPRNGVLSIDISRLDNFERVPLPEKVVPGPRRIDNSWSPVDN
ncbi:MAG TPA: ion channel [Thermoanaerobaculia bacterium]|nr:ion channel [Thermoanaerobaculia bacterium]